MNKAQAKKFSERLVVFLLITSLLIGTVLFISMIPDKPLSERMILYSILIILGIGFSIETAMYKRFKVEHQKIDAKIATAGGLPSQEEKGQNQE